MQEGRQPGPYMISGSAALFAMILRTGRVARPFRSVLFFSILPLVATAGCMFGSVRALRDVPFGGGPPPIRWFSPGAEDAPVLARWRVGVGPPVLSAGRGTLGAAVDGLTIVSWNTALGAGDIPRFVRSLPPAGATVLLLQEVYRGGPEVPAVLPPDAAFAPRKGGAAAGSRYEEIESVAAALGLWLYYVPSMRNGTPAASSEDRGNAILSSLPLQDLAAFELPFERQRRVALAGTIAGSASAGAPWRLRLVNAHLDNTFDLRRLWLAAEYGRTRQARSLLSALPIEEPLILGGDFNTWSGFSDQTYLTLARAFPSRHVTDPRATFLGVLRLDHLFFRLDPGWTATVRRGDDRFGSDHYPLIATVRVGR